ncbi:MAG: glycine dehydrogenase (aminomethyl-transferring), partial [Pseudonocardiaceae bacterium]
MNTADRRSLSDLEHGTPFADRHIGPRPAEVTRMLDVIGVESLEQLARLALPPGLLDQAADSDIVADLPAAATDVQALVELRERAARCHPRVPMIGMGYHGTVTPPVIRRSVLENPAWYTA